jgi:hypothetical protein
VNEFITLAYTVSGGVVGAGLNQYVTNIGQRRTARATVVEKVAETEALYSRMRWPEIRPLDDSAAKNCIRKWKGIFNLLKRLV